MKEQEMRQQEVENASSSKNRSPSSIRTWPSLPRSAATPSYRCSIGEAPNPGHRRCYRKGPERRTFLR